MMDWTLIGEWAWVAVKFLGLAAIAGWLIKHAIRLIARDIAYGWQRGVDEYRQRKVKS